MEPCEVLEAYDKLELTIAGTGHTLLLGMPNTGFQPYPAIATLNSVSSDGGMIPCLELIVTKVRAYISHFWKGSDADAIQVYPIASIEFHKDADGKSHTRGPTAGERRARGARRSDRKPTQT